MTFKRVKMTKNKKVQVEPALKNIYSLNFLPIKLDTDALRNIQKNILIGKHKNNSIVTATGFFIENPRVAAVIIAAAKQA